MSLHAYEEYKESGLEWVPKLPAHWRHTQLGRIARIFAGGTPDRTNLDYWTDGTVPWLNSGAVNDGSITQPSEWITEEASSGGRTRWVPARSVLVALAGQGKTKGMAARLEFASTCNQSMAAIVPDLRVDYRFLHFWLNANYQNIRNLAGGDLRDGLNLQHISAITLPVPPTAEQQTIADYLDHETAEIDAFIMDQEELIGLLNERRSAFRDYLIQEAEKSASPKPLKRAAYVTVGIVVTPSAWYASEGVPALRGLNIKEGAIALDNVVHLTEEGHALHKKSILREDDVVVVRTGQAGTAARVPKEMDGYNAIDLLIAKPRQELIGEYLTLVINSRAVRGQISAGSVGAIQGHFNVESLRNLVLRIPTVSIQEDAVARWNAERNLIDAAVADAREAISLSKERRAAVISAAVTGRIDVRDHAVTVKTIIQGEPVGVA